MRQVINFIAQTLIIISLIPLGLLVGFDIMILALMLPFIVTLFAAGTWLHVEPETMFGEMFESLDDRMEDIFWSDFGDEDDQS